MDRWRCARVRLCDQLLLSAIDIFRVMHICIHVGAHACAVVALMMTTARISNEYVVATASVLRELTTAPTVWTARCQ